MAKETVLVGTTSRIEYLFIRDAVTGLAKTGLAWNTSGLAASYCLSGAARVAITLATQTVTGAYSSGGFVEIDSTNMPGVYRFDVPNAALASGNKSIIQVIGTNLIVAPMEYQLVAYNPDDATALGLSVWTTAISDSVPADGTIPSPLQALYMIMQFLGERSVSGTTLTVKKVNGSTSLMTFTLDSATAPTSITRAT